MANIHSSEKIRPMPVSKDFTLPTLAKLLALPKEPESKFFIAFISSADPTTKQPWCPDVRVALPRINALFSANDSPKIELIEVGQRPE